MAVEDLPTYLPTRVPPPIDRFLSFLKILLSIHDAHVACTILMEWLVKDLFNSIEKLLAR